MARTWNAAVVKYIILSSCFALNEHHEEQKLLLVRIIRMHVYSLFVKMFI
jgi:hypothetical protein